MTHHGALRTMDRVPLATRDPEATIYSDDHTNPGDVETSKVARMARIPMAIAEWALKRK